jgi:hypothetical protein
MSRKNKPQVIIRFVGDNDREVARCTMPHDERVFWLHPKMQKHGGGGCLKSHAQVLLNFTVEDLAAIRRIEGLEQFANLTTVLVHLFSALSPILSWPRIDEVLRNLVALHICLSAVPPVLRNLVRAVCMSFILCSNRVLHRVNTAGQTKKNL